MSGRPLVALDLDGTLEDSRRDMVAAIARVRASLELPERPYEALVPHVSRGMGALYRACFDDLLEGEPSRYEAVREAYEAAYGDRIAEHTRLYEGMPEALAELSGLAALAVVTNKPEALSRRLLEALGVGGRIAAVVGGDTLPTTKPDPRLLAEAALRAEASGRVLMVGDSAGDVKMGRAYGAVTLWCAWGYAESCGEERPDLVAREPGELPALVREALAAGR